MLSACCSNSGLYYVCWKSVRFCPGRLPGCKQHVWLLCDGSRCRVYSALSAFSCCFFSNAFGVPPPNPAMHAALESDKDLRGVTHTFTGLMVASPGGLHPPLLPPPAVFSGQTLLPCESPPAPPGLSVFKFAPSLFALQYLQCF